MPAVAVAAVAVLSTPGCAATGQAAPVAVLTDVQSGTTMPVRVGDIVEIRLPAQPGTGFTWVATYGDGLEPAQPVTTAPATALPGGFETEVHRVRVRAGGRHDLRFEYRQPWEGGEQASREVGYTFATR